MGMSVTLHSIDKDSYKAAISGDYGAFEVMPDSSTDLDKAWHIIHYMLTGNRELKFLEDGVVLDMASEHMEVQSPEQVAKLHARFKSESPDVIVRSADWQEVKSQNIYPELDARSSEYVLTYMNIFASAVRRAATANHGLFIIIA